MKSIATVLSTSCFTCCREELRERGNAYSSKISSQMFLIMPVHQLHRMPDRYLYRIILTLRMARSLASNFSWPLRLFDLTVFREPTMSAL
jgi:hypothetical protein